jgi:(E)-4-hydroxy-3-methylbut-2-enyl-diphosphate synthase
VAKALADRYNTRSEHKAIPVIEHTVNYNPFEYNRREVSTIVNLGNHQVPRVIADYSMKSEITAASLFGVGYNYSVPLDKWNLNDLAVDYIFAGDNLVNFEIPGTLGIIYNSQTWLTKKTSDRSYPLFCADEFFRSEETHPHLNFIAVDIETLTATFLEKLKINKNAVLVLDSFNEAAMPELRRMCVLLQQVKSDIPIIIKRNFKALSESDFQLYSSTDFGGLLLDGFGDGIWIKQKDCVSTQVCNSTAFGILQATRTRISKTEYISCPSCGRTLFDLQETTQKIRMRTDHLKGIKIGIMGCIVNGPGEMADADYGYVGTGPGKISLYKGKEVVKKNVQSENAVDELIELIKSHGDWVEVSQG